MNNWLRLIFERVFMRARRTVHNQSQFPFIDSICISICIVMWLRLGSERRKYTNTQLTSTFCVSECSRECGWAGNTRFFAHASKRECVHAKNVCKMGKSEMELTKIMRDMVDAYITIRAAKVKVFTCECQSV